MCRVVIEDQNDLAAPGERPLNAFHEDEKVLSIRRRGDEEDGSPETLRNGAVYGAGEPRLVQDRPYRMLLRLPCPQFVEPEAEGGLVDVAQALSQGEILPETCGEDRSLGIEALTVLEGLPVDVLSVLVGHISAQVELAQLGMFHVDAEPLGDDQGARSQAQEAQLV